MIQRKQTLFLLLAAVALAVAAVMNTGTVLMLVLLIVSAVLCAGIIFVYKNRKRQILLTLLPMALLLAWYVLLAVNNFQMAWPDALPAVAILFIVLARQGIVHDEKLVRSLDRIR